jgi:radical SAM protein with 4Fe4S-binding SPASM domain
MPRRDPAELTTAEARDLIDEIAGFGRPSPLFVITGGDPTKREDLDEIVTHAVSRGIATALSPSATPQVTAERLAELHALGIKAISLSLDGSTAAIHDAFRGFPGVFDRTLRLWDAAREAGLRVQINTTVTRHNVGDLAFIARLLCERGAFLWSVFFLVPTGRGRLLEQISAAECEEVMHFLYDVGTRLPVKTTEGHHFKRVVLERDMADPNVASRSRRSPMDVNAGRGFVFISHTGEIFPSGFLPLAAGNARTQSLREVYRTSDLFRALRDPSRLKGRCGRCSFASVCGGSRSRAYAVTGDPFAEDPLCAYQPPEGAASSGAFPPRS